MFLGCRSSSILPAFSFFMKQKFGGLPFFFPISSSFNASSLKIAFAVRENQAETGARAISNLAYIQSRLQKRKHLNYSIQNITFEHLAPSEMILAMSRLHVFISVHGAGMTNMFFMNAGAAVIEIIPWPLCNCKSGDYFYGTGGYYHGSAVALGLRHYSLCIPAEDVKWNVKPKQKLKSGVRCSWRHLHAVESVFVDPFRLVSILRNIERDMVFSRRIVLTERPLVELSPHING